MKVETNSAIAPAAVFAADRKAGPGKFAESWMGEPGTLNEAARLSAEWFARFLHAEGR